MSAQRMARIDEFCKTGSGGTPSRANADRYYRDGVFPWVKSGELRETVIYKTEEYVTAAAIKETSVKLVPAGALLVAMYGATVGRLGILGIPATTNQAVCHIVPDPEAAEVRYLFHALRDQVAHLVSRGVGGAQPNISQQIVRNLEIPLPPLAEQRRLAEILDNADALRFKRLAAISQLNTLGQSIFLDLFGDPVTNSKGWDESKALGEMADIVSGVTKGRELRGNSARTVSYLAVLNVQDKHLDLSTVKTIEATEDEINRYRLVRNDLLLTEGGDPDKLGRGTLWNCELPECIHQNHIFRVRLTTDQVHPVFLNWLIGSQRGKRYFLRSAKQTTGIASINMTQLRGFPMFIPPFPLQVEFAERLFVVEKAKRAHLNSLTELDALFRSLQSRAFRGEL